jgi:hypothetical protein
LSETAVYALNFTKLEAVPYQHDVATAVSRRSTYTLAGQTIAVRVSGDPNTTQNGLFYLYSDHLDSTRAIQHPDGMVVQARYLPFGGWRTEPGNLPTSRGYTGHAHNNLGSGGADDLGLIYMQARFYVPYPDSIWFLSRF